MVDPRDVPVRFSNLKQMAKSAAHYRAAVQVGRPDTPTFRRGRLVHAMVLGGLDEFAVYEGKRQGNAWKEFEAAHIDREFIVTASEMDAARPIADAVLADSDAMALLEGECEVPVNWTNLGRVCSSRIDVIGRRWVTELKTSVDSSPWRFPHLAVRLDYHAQLSWYQHAARFMGRQDVDAAHIVAVEPVPPYAVTKFNLTPSALVEGEKRWRGWMERLLVCEAANLWPSYSEASVDLDVPGEGDDALTVEGEELVF
jgi:hypothetical protein